MAEEPELNSPKKLAQDAITHVQPAVRKFILDMALERARSQLSLSIALDARITQASYIQFAAAAVAAALSGLPGGHDVSISSGVSAAVAFAIGGALCFRGIRSDPHHAPGLPPAWWSGAIQHANFSLAFAQCWAAGAIQEMMDEVERENIRRADNLNLSLRFSLAGAALLTLSALSRIFNLT